MDIRFNTKHIKPDVWVKAFEEELAKERETVTIEHIHLIERPTQIQLDKLSETHTKTIQTALEKSSKPRRISPQSKGWWDEYLKNAAAQVNEARREQHTYQQLLGEYSPQIQAKICRSRNFFKRRCRFKKRSWINKTLEESSSEDIWKFPAWSKGVRIYPRVIEKDDLTHPQRIIILIFGSNG